MPEQVGFVPSLREAVFDLGKINEESRTVEVVWTTGAAVDRRKFDWDNWRVMEFTEELDVSTKAVRMDRINSGAAPVLDGHDYWSVRQGQIGVVDKAWITGGEGRAVLRFSKRDDVNGLWQDIKDGIARNVSVGYDVHKWEIVKEENKKERWIARDWTPMEISMVPIGADPDAGVRNAEPGSIEMRSMKRPERVSSAEILNRADTPKQEEKTMANNPIETASTGNEPAVERTAPAPAPAPAEKTWNARELKTLQQRATLFGLDASLAADAMENSRTLEEATDWLQNKAVAAQPKRTVPRVEILRDEGDTIRRAVGDAVLHRAAPKSVNLDDASRQWRGMTLLEIGRSYVEDTNGIRLRGYSPNELASVLLGNTRAPGMHGTSDFPLILANVIDKRLRGVYDTAPSLWKLFCRQSNVNDFKMRYVNQLSEAPRLEKVPEHGEFKRGSLSEQGVSYKIDSYGRVIGFSRQMLINDDMGAFDRMPQMFGQAAVDNEADIVWKLLLSNPAMGDGVVLFNTATHGNLASAGAALSVTSLGAARTAMRKQKNLAKKQVISVQASYLIVPPELETLAEQLLAQNMIPSQSANVVPDWFQSLTPIVETRLSDTDYAGSSTTAWYLAAEPSRIDTIEYAYLSGQEGIYTEQRVGFDVDGIELKIRHDFGAAAIDWRGFYKNNGA